MINAQLVMDAKDIFIVSGEGCGPGTTEKYTGKRTIRAIRSRLTKERCGGDRWAKAFAYSHSNDYGDAYVNIETGEYGHVV